MPPLVSRQKTQEDGREQLGRELELHEDRLLGEGSFGRVILGTTISTQTPFAVKVINRSRLEDAALRRWVNECVFHADSALWRAFCPRGAARAGVTRN